MSEVLLQTRVPEEIGARVQALAQIRGESIAGWLRRTVIKESAMSRIGAWMGHKNHVDPMVTLDKYNRGEPPYYLEPVRDYGPLDRVFNLFGSDAVTPVHRQRWQETQGFKATDDQRFLLDGSPHVWRIGSATFNSTTGLMELTLRCGASPLSFRPFDEATTRYKELGASFLRVALQEPDRQRAEMVSGPVVVAMNIHRQESDAIIVPRLVAMLERGLGLQ